MNYSFADPAAEDRHTTQYFEIGGSRGIYHEGWVACAAHRTSPWNLIDPDTPDLRDDRWELYDTTSDWSQARDLAAEYPDKLEELKELFLLEAARHQVLPLDDRALAVRRNADDRGRIESMTFHAGTRRLPPDAMPNVLNTSYSVTARIDVPAGGADGVICAQGGRFSGWTLYCRDGTLTFCQNVGAKVFSYVRAAEPLTPGPHEVRYDFVYDGGGLGQGGEGTLFVDGESVGEGRIERTVAFLFPIGEDFNVGVDPITPVTPEYAPVRNAFTGRLAWVRIDLGEGIEPTPEHRLRAEMATQ